MSDKRRLQLLQDAIDELKKTQEGYKKAGQAGGHWRAAMQRLEALEDDLKVHIPALGPVWVGGKTVLQQDLTHMTSNMPEGDIYPAFDDAFVVGTVIIAPEKMEVTRESSSRPGKAFYATGDSKIRYWFGHLDRTHPVGKDFKKGDVVGKVAPNNIGGGPHVHVGVDARKLNKGKVLLHHTNYTHGAPTVGAQLKKALSG